MLYYLNINSGEKSKRHELKDGEIALLAGLRGVVPYFDFARSLKGKNNFADMNRLIDACWQKLEKGKRADLLLLIDKDKMEGLSKPFDFYLCEISKAYMSEGSYIKALEYVDKAMEIRPNDSQLLVLKGYFLYKLNTYNEAIACLNVALELQIGSTDKATALDIRAKCYDALGMRDRADRERSATQRTESLPTAPVMPPSAQQLANTGQKIPLLKKKFLRKIGVITGLVVGGITGGVIEWITGWTTEGIKSIAISWIIVGVLGLAVGLAVGVAVGVIIGVIGRMRISVFSVFKLGGGVGGIGLVMGWILGVITGLVGGVITGLVGGVTLGVILGAILGVIVGIVAVESAYEENLIGRG